MRGETYRTVIDARKHDTVLAALKAGRIAEAAHLGRVFERHPVTPSEGG